jgi:hypothetical protein
MQAILRDGDFLTSFIGSRLLQLVRKWKSESRFLPPSHLAQPRADLGLH